MNFEARTVLIALAISGLSIAPAWSGGLRELDQTIFGMDCAPCAAGIEKGLRKLDGVTSVRVSLNDGKAVVSLAPESRATLAQIREVIRRNGFTPKEARATLVGRLVRDGDRLWIETGNGRFALETDSATVPGRVVLQGTGEVIELSVHVPEKLTEPPTVQLIASASGG